MDQISVDRCNTVEYTKDIQKVIRAKSDAGEDDTFSGVIPAGVYNSTVGKERGAVIWEIT